MGGRSRRPTLIASQVELQTTQSVSHAAGIRQSRRLATKTFCERICATVALGRFLVKCCQFCRRASILVAEYESIRNGSRVCKLRRSPRYRLLGHLLLVDAPDFTAAKRNASRVAASGPKHRSGVERGTRDPQGTPSYGAKNRRERRSGQGIDRKLSRDG